MRLRNIVLVVVDLIAGQAHPTLPGLRAASGLGVQLVACSIFGLMGPSVV